MAALALMCGCSGDPPSCQQALTHYYSAGCVYRVSGGAEVPRDDLILDCQKAAAQASDQCNAALDEWLECNDSVPTPSTTSADCDCSREYQEFVACK